jgi:hypothetical protein
LVRLIVRTRLANTSVFVISVNCSNRIGGMEWLLDILLMVLLAATLFHAVRLERALGVLKRDRGALEDLVEGFNSSTRAAEQSIARLHAAADGAGRHIAKQIELGQALREDLRFLGERGEQIADRLEQQVRGSRMVPSDLSRTFPTAGEARRGTPEPPQRPSESRYLADMVGAAEARYSPQTLQDDTPQMTSAAGIAEPRVRSQAERDLLRALRMAR